MTDEDNVLPASMSSSPGSPNAGISVRRAPFWMTEYNSPSEQAPLRPVRQIAWEQRTYLPQRKRALKESTPITH